MTCDRAITLLTTGGPLGRWRTRRHVARCPHCAAEADRLRRITRELSIVEPLSAAQRALWSSASTDPRPSASRPPRIRRPLVAGWAAAVVLLLAANLAWKWARGPGPRPPVVIADPPASPDLGVRPETVRELDGLAMKLRALSRDLALLRGRAELLDERKEAESLARRVGRPSVAARDRLGPPMTFSWDANPLPVASPDRGTPSAASPPSVGMDDASGRAPGRTSATSRHVRPMDRPASSSPPIGAADPSAT
jgi:hypothetical protein